MDFTQSMDNGYMIPTSVAVGSGEATDIRCVCDTVEDFKTFLNTTGMELRYEGLVTYEKVNKLLKVYKGNDTWQTVGEGGGNVDTSSFITLTQLSQQLSNYYTKAQTDNKISEEIAKAQLGGGGEVDLSAYATKNFVSDEISKIELKEGPQGEQGPQGPQGEQGPQGPAGTVDTSNFYNKSEIDKKISDIVIESGNIIFRDVEHSEIFEIEGSETVSPPPSQPAITYGNIIISTSSLSVSEGDTTNFTVKLDKAPTNNQTVNISVNNAYCVLDKASLTFEPNNYSVAQTVTINGIHDSANYSDKSSIINISSANVSSKTISVTIKNIDEKDENIENPETPASNIRFEFDYNKYNGETSYTSNGITATLNKSASKTENGVFLKGSALDVPYSADLVKTPYTIEIVGRGTGEMLNRTYPLIDNRYSKGSGNGFVIGQFNIAGQGLSNDLGINGALGYSSTAISGYSITSGEEFNLKFVYNGSAIKTYLNGELKTTNNMSFNAQRGFLVMGFNYDTYFNGYLKKFVVYDGEVI